MSAALVIVYVCLTAVEVAVVIAWVAATRRHRWPVRPSTGDVVIGGVTSFLDTLGIGNYAQITALFKLRGYPPDELIPGTLNVGNAVGILFSAAHPADDAGSSSCSWAWPCYSPPDSSR